MWSDTLSALYIFADLYKSHSWTNGCSDGSQTSSMITPRPLTRRASVTRLQWETTDPSDSYHTFIMDFPMPLKKVIASPRPVYKESSTVSAPLSSRGTSRSQRERAEYGNGSHSARSNPVSRVPNESPYPLFRNTPLQLLYRNSPSPSGATERVTVKLPREVDYSNDIPKTDSPTSQEETPRPTSIDFRLPLPRGLSAKLQKELMPQHRIRAYSDPTRRNTDRTG